MLDYISGILERKEADYIVVEAGGIGYKISVAQSAFEKLAPSGSFVKIYVVEAVAGMYGGVASLYGFLTHQERDMYLLVKDEVPGTGAKKALEYLDKISKSFADFKAAVLSKNAAMLSGVFGFTKKTAEKLIAALKDKIAAVSVCGEEKWQTAAGAQQSSVAAEAVSGLVALGYKEPHARIAVNEIYSADENISLEDLIKKALGVYREDR